MIEMDLELAGMEPIRKVFGVMPDVIGSMEPIWRNYVHPYFLRHMRYQFQSEGRHGGDAWAGYHREPQYAAMRHSLIGRRPILHWEKGRQRLKPSLTKEFHAKHIFTTTRTKVTAGTSVPYAGRLAAGGTGPFGERYPGRSILAMTRGQIDDLTTGVHRRIMEQAGADRLREGRERLQRRLSQTL